MARVNKILAPDEPRGTFDAGVSLCSPYRQSSESRKKTQLGAQLDEDPPGGSNRLESSSANQRARWMFFLSIFFC